MYKIIGADGKEYGPISADQIRQWITEGRLNAQSQVLPEGGAIWKTIGEVPELASSLPIAPPAGVQPGFAPTAGSPDAANQVSGPAIGLMVVAGLAICVAVVNVILMLAGVSAFPMQDRGTPPEFAKFAQGVGGVVGALIAFGIYGTMFFGAWKMKRLESYGLAMTASILALLPCSICCLIGLPIGIWSLVVLNKPGVKAAFH
jgi:hypothetical protein